MTAILLDIDGVLHVSGEAVPGAPEAVQALRDKGHRLRFVTNNTTRARGALAGELQAIGFDLESEDITTTSPGTSSWSTTVPTRCSSAEPTRVRRRAMSSPTTGSTRPTPSSARGRA